MSGKYSDVRLAYTPSNENDMRGELLFKVTYQQKGNTLNYWGNTKDIPTKFFSGLGGWNVGVVAAQSEIVEFGVSAISSQLAMTSNNATTKKLVNHLSALSKKNDDLSKRIQQLYDQIYTVRYYRDATALSSPSRLQAAISSNWPIASGVQVYAANIALNGAGTAINPGVSYPFITVVVNVSAPHIKIDTATKWSVGTFDLAGRIATRLAPGPSGRIGVPAHDGKTIFSWDINQLLANLGPRPVDDDVFTSLIGTVDGPHFEQKVRRGNNGQLQVQNSDGKWQDLTDAVRGQHACIGVAATKACEEIGTCLAQPNPDGKPNALLTVSCLNALQNNRDDLWKTDKADISQMNPKAAFFILKNLGFKGKKVGNRVKCESVADWQGRVSSDSLTDDKGAPVILGPVPPYTVAQIKALCNNKNLTQYLKLVVSYIDHNPAILNQGATGTGTSTVVDEFGLKAPRSNKIIDGQLNSMRYNIPVILERTNYHINSLMGYFGIPIPLVSFGGAIPSSLTGGNYNGRKVQIPKFSTGFRAVYNSYLNRLKSMNKTLSQKTKTTVEEVFKSLEDKENKLSSWIDYLQRYYEITKLEGNSSNENISEEDLKNAYNKYEKSLNKLRRRAINTVDILTTLSQATNDMENSNDVNLPSGV